MVTNLNEWSHASIMDWMRKNSVLDSQLTQNERKAITAAFIEVANKHQDTPANRRMYRSGLKVIKSPNAQNAREFAEIIR